MEIEQYVEPEKTMHVEGILTHVVPAKQTLQLIERYLEKMIPTAKIKITKTNREYTEYLFSTDDAQDFIKFGIFIGCYYQQQLNKKRK